MSHTTQLMDYNSTLSIEYDPSPTISTPYSTHTLQYSIDTLLYSTHTLQPYRVVYIYIYIYIYITHDLKYCGSHY